MDPLSREHEENEIVIICDDTEPATEFDEVVAQAMDPRVGADDEDVDGSASKPADPMVRNATMALRSRDVTKQPTQRQSRVAIYDGPEPQLDEFNPWEEAREADEYLRRGVQPSVAKAQGADILILGNRNGLLLWICLVQVIVVVVLTVFVVHTALTLPARAVPATAEVEIYKKVTLGSAQVTAFAKYFTQESETWSHWDAKALPAKIMPLLDPVPRGEFETKFLARAREVQIYKGRQFYELAALRYLGVLNETDHRVVVFYRSYTGRGDDEKSFDLDKVTRRAKVLVIGEVDATAENDWGLQVINHYDLTEAQYVSSKKENPWDLAEGKPDSAKAKARSKAKAVTK